MAPPPPLAAAVVATENIMLTKGSDPCPQKREEARSTSSSWPQRRGEGQLRASQEPGGLC